MEYTKIMVETYRRAVDGKLVIVSVAKGKPDKAIPLFIGDPWEGTAAEGTAYIAKWTIPAASVRETEILEFTDNDAKTAEELAQICKVAEKLAFDPSAARSWPYKVVFSDADLSWTEAFRHPLPS